MTFQELSTSNVIPLISHKHQKQMEDYESEARRHQKWLGFLLGTQVPILGVQGLVFIVWNI